MIGVDKNRIYRFIRERSGNAALKTYPNFFNYWMRKFDLINRKRTGMFHSIDFVSCSLLLDTLKNQIVKVYFVEI